MEPVADRAAAMLASHSQKEPSLQVGTHALRRADRACLHCSPLHRRYDHRQTGGRQGAAHVFSWSVPLPQQPQARAALAMSCISSTCQYPLSTLSLPAQGCMWRGGRAGSVGRLADCKTLICALACVRILS